MRAERTRGIAGTAGLDLEIRGILHNQIGLQMKLNSLPGITNAIS